MTTAKALPLALLVFLGASQSMLRAAVPVCINDADCIQPGFDLFATLPGTFFTINGVPVPLMGIPDPMNSGADTIVQRLGTIDVLDQVGSMQVVNTQMTELNLTGVDPSCPQTGTPCNVFVHLDPAHPTLAVEGTFTSFFDVFFDLSFQTLGGAPLPCDPQGHTSCLQPDLTLTGSGTWTDNNGQFFVVGGQVTETHPSPPGLHIAKQITPEPGFVFLNLALVGVLLVWKFRQNKETSL
jgi:hypothetical protein